MNPNGNILLVSTRALTELTLARGEQPTAAELVEFGVTGDYTIRGFTVADEQRWVVTSPPPAPIDVIASEQPAAAPPKYITTFVVTAPSAAKPVLDAIREAGHKLRKHPFANAMGMNIATMESYETWQTTMPLAQLEPIAVEAGPGPAGGPGELIMGASPTSRSDWQ